MSTAIDTEQSRLAVNTIRFLAVDAVEQANSGHPGLPMGAADIAFVLWTQFLRYDPQAPTWADRDRFILSAGHGCMLLYAMLHLSGYDLPLEQLKQFRQWDSKTPGHPEFGHTVGVEATTGPLGQGISNATGMATAAKMLAARFNDGAGFQPVNHRIFVLASDGDVMEGVSGEAASLAGHLGLGNIVVLYDDNQITIEGRTDLAFSEDVAGRYEALGWHTDKVDGHDHGAIERAVHGALAVTDKPSLIACRTLIAKGAPNKQDSSSAHGSPLGAEETAAAKQAAGWPAQPTFHVPDAVRELFAERGRQGSAQRQAWERDFEGWRTAHPDRAQAWDVVHRQEAPSDIVDHLVAHAPTGSDATRNHSGNVLQVAAEKMPELVGGSADLAPSNKSTIKSATAVQPDDFSGRVFHFGVREHAMGAFVNGMLYHGAFRPFGATFLVFSDYMRPAIRLAALSHLPAIYIFTHDSIFVGEDGPTHEPIEHAAALRAIPHLDVYRPADGKETAVAWGLALQRTDGPSALLLTRQKLPPIEVQGSDDRSDPTRGAYLVAGDDSPDAIVAASGSEVHLAVAARETLAGEGKKLNVVSIPCFERFEAQGPAYRDRLFPVGVPVATAEAGITAPWRHLAGRDGLTLGIDRYGASAPYKVMGEKFGFTPQAVTDRIRDWLK